MASYGTFNIDTLCPTIVNASTFKNEAPIRITVFGAPLRCYDQAFILNAIINAVRAPVQLEFAQSNGKLLDGKWTGAIGQLVYNRCDVAISKFSATYERFQATQLSTPLYYSSPIVNTKRKVTTEFNTKRFPSI